MSVDRSHRILESLATVLMAIATVATAWCAYQSTLWSGVEEFQLHEAQALSRESLASRAHGTQLTMLDVNLFTNFVNANASGNSKLATFYTERFSPRLKPAFAAWTRALSADPSHAPKHPFEMKEYVVPQNVRSDSLNAAYNREVATARASNAHSEDYVLLTVIYASVLFFGGITTNIKALSTKRILVGASTILLLVSLGWMLSLPLAT